MKIEDLMAYYGDLKAEKQPYENLYQNCYDYTQPDKDRFNSMYGEGERGNRHIFDHTAEYSVDVMASSIIGIIANPATRWVGVEMVDERLNKKAAVAKWSEAAGQTLLNHINRPSAGFYRALKPSLVDMVIVGMPTTYVEEVKPSGFRFVSFPPSRVFFDISMEDRVDTVAYCMEMTVKQLKERQRSDGWELHKNVEDLFKANKLNNKIKVVKFVMPRFERDEQSLAAKDMPIACYYVDEQHKTVMYEGGYQEMSVAVGRWSVKTGEKYPRSPVSSIIGEVQNLNVARRDLIVAVEKANEPSVWLPQGSEMGGKTIDFGSRTVNFYDATKGQPYFESGIKDVSALFELVSGMQSNVRTMLYNDQLQMVGTQQMTATEVMQRVDERARLIAPNIGNIMTDYLAVLLERCLRILIRQGEIPPPPEEIVNKEFRISFSTPLLRAQRAQDAINIQTAVQSVALLGQAVGNMDAMDNIDVDATVAEVLDIHGVKGMIGADEQTVAAKRQQRAAAMQQQTQMESANMLANTAAKAGQAQQALTQ